MIGLLAALLPGVAAAAGFTGVAAPGNFAVANSGSLTGAPALPGTAAFSATELRLTGGDAATGCDGGLFGDPASPCALLVTLGRAGDYSFSWAYDTADGFGPGSDLFGVVVDGQRVGLSDPGGAINQAGSASFTASASFGWYINCTDCSGGSASALISNFSTTAVPEPGAAALLLAGLAGLAVTRGRAAARRVPAG